MAQSSPPSVLNLLNRSAMRYAGDDASAADHLAKLVTLAFGESGSPKAKAARAEIGRLASILSTAEARLATVSGGVQSA